MKPLLPWLLVALVLGAGIPRLVVDPAAPFALPEDDPVRVATEAMTAATGGDDVVLVALYRPEGLLDGPGITAIEALRERLEREPGLERVRAVHRTPLLSNEGGVISAVTPLWPVPEGVELEAARARVLADPFAVRSLVGPEGRVAVLPAWVKRASAETLLASIAAKELKDEAVRTTPAGMAAKGVVEAARLAVALGDEEGPADAVIAKRLLALDENPLVRSWQDQAELTARDPSAAALAGARRALAGVELPPGARGAVLGQAAVEDVAGKAFPLGVGVALMAILGALTVLGLARGGDGLRPALLGTVAAVAVFGALGWSGGPLHGLTGLLPLGAVLVAGLGTRRVPLPVVLAAVAPLAGLALGARAPGLLVGLLVLVALGIAAGVTAPDGARDLVPRSRAAALVMAALGLLALALTPLGMDPSAVLGEGVPEGALTARLQDAGGMAAPASLVLVGDGPGALARPESLQALADAQGALAEEDGAAASTTWADFLARLHGAVSGGEVGLPPSEALVDQYLLLFGRPEETRPLVASDRSVGGGFLWLEEGQGARLGALSGLVDGGPVVVAGAAASLARAARLEARSAALFGGVGLLLGVILLLVGGRDPLVPLAAALCGAAVTALLAGAGGWEACFVGACGFGLAGASPRTLRLAGVGGAAALASPVLGLLATGAGLATAALLAWGLAVPERSGEIGAR